MWNIEAKRQLIVHNVCRALDSSNNVLLVIHFSPHSTFEGHDSPGKANFFFTTVEGQHNLQDGRNVFPSVPYYSNMLHNTLYVMLGASLLHHEYKLTRIPKRNSAQKPFLFHPPIICPLSYHTGCPTRYQTRHFFNNSNTNEDIATKFEQEYFRCVRNVTTS